MNEHFKRLPVRGEPDMIIAQNMANFFLSLPKGTFFHYEIKYKQGHPKADQVLWLEETIEGAETVANILPYLVVGRKLKPGDTYNGLNNKIHTHKHI